MIIVQELTVEPPPLGLGGVGIWNPVLLVAAGKRITTALLPAMVGIPNEVVVPKAVAFCVPVSVNPRSPRFPAGLWARLLLSKSHCPRDWPIVVTALNR